MSVTSGGSSRGCTTGRPRCDWPRLERILIQVAGDRAALGAGLEREEAAEDAGAVDRQRAARRRARAEKRAQPRAAVDPPRDAGPDQIGVGERQVAAQTIERGARRRRARARPSA